MLEPYNNAEKWVKQSGSPFVYVSQVAVRPEHAGKAIGTKLYEAMLRDTKGQKLLLTISCDPPNEPSVRFHEKMGFKKIKEVTEEDGTKWWVYEKKK